MMPTSLARVASSSALLARLLDAPDLVAGVRALPPASFSTLVRQVGIEDAGELLALATTAQLVRAFDEDLFVNEAPGERESFDRARFAVWLQVLLEGGDAALAARFVELSEDFVVHAISSVLLVLDDDALRERMSAGGRDAEAADKALECSLTEAIDGYLLVALEPEAWDATLSLVLVLDRHHHDFLERILDRCAGLSSPCLDDLDELTTRLSELDALADQVEADREDRRSALGFVEPRAARNFLELARRPSTSSAAAVERDPITRAYFRELGGRRSPAHGTRTSSAHVPSLSSVVGQIAGAPLAALPTTAPEAPLVAALRALERSEPAVFVERLEELAYLANVLLAGAEREEERWRPAEAVEAVLATVTFGAMLEALAHRGAPADLVAVLLACSADRLFRRASGALSPDGFLRSTAELETALERLGARAPRAARLASAAASPPAAKPGRPRRPRRAGRG